MKNNVHASITLILFFALTAHVQASVRPFIGCDTLTTVEGKVYLVSNVEIQWQEIHFTSCGDAAKVYAIPKNRVASIKKARMPRVYLPQLTAPKQIAPPRHELKYKFKHSPAAPIDSAMLIADKAFKLGVLALCCSLSIIFSPIGFLIGVFALAKATKGFTLIENRPKRRKVNRKLWLAVAFGGFALLPIIGLILILTAFARSIPDSSWDLSIGSWWSPF